MKNLLLLTIITVITISCANTQKSEIFETHGKAINGYDVVAFYKNAMAIKGTESMKFSYLGVQWLFSSRENMEAFKNDPEHFIPQYGGYCAYGAAAGHKAPTQAETWKIENDKLYFNYSPKVKEIWLKDQQSLIEKADKQWPHIKKTE